MLLDVDIFIHTGLHNRCYFYSRVYLVCHGGKVLHLWLVIQVLMCGIVGYV